MFANTVNLYKNNTLIDTQTFNVSGVYSDAPLALEVLLEKGITFPDMPNEGGKTFLRWERTGFEANTELLINVYEYSAVYIRNDLSVDYCDNHIDEVIESIDNNTSSMGLNLDKTQTKLTKVDNLLDVYSNADEELEQAITQITNANNDVSNKLDYIEGQGLSEQMSLINIKIRAAIRTLNYTGAYREALLHYLRNQLEQNEERLTTVQTSLVDKPKYYFMNQSDYENVSNPDISAIYFVKE